MSRGFTLIELVVALFITAIMSAIGYSAVNQALEGRKALEQQQTRIIAVQHAMQLLEQDIVSIVPRPVRNPLGDDYQAAVVANASSPDNSSTSPSTGAMNTSSVSASSLVQNGATPRSFTRAGWSNPTGLPRTELQRVSYRLADGKLLRYHLRVLDATSDSTATARELLDDVESLSFRYMDAGHHWSETWQPNAGSGGTREPRLRMRPIAVEVSLKLKDWGTLVRVIEIAG